MSESISRQAVAWIMAGDRAGEKRTQQAAADKFGIPQSAVSIAMRRHVDPRVKPDGRRRKPKEI